jgi:transketolase
LTSIIQKKRVNKGGYTNMHDLDLIARETRNDILTMTTEAGSGHPGGSLSCVEILVALYFDNVMGPNDVFILSKGHAAPALYSILARKGLFPKEELMNLRKFGALLQGHPTSNIPGVVVSTGSLGQGLSIACGIALAKKMDSKKGIVYVLLGDGECQEGQVWEAAMYASHMKLDNLVAIIDKNGWQVDGRTTMCDNFWNKFMSFGWGIWDGKIRSHHAPSICVVETVKGAGISKLEHNNEYHGKVLTKEELQGYLA